MDATQVFMLDTLLKSLPMDALQKAKEKLSDESTQKCIEIADLVCAKEQFGIKDLIAERELLNVYISRIDVQINILTNQEKYANASEI